MAVNDSYSDIVSNTATAQYRFVTSSSYRVPGAINVSTRLPVVSTAVPHVAVDAFNNEDTSTYMQLTDSLNSTASASTAEIVPDNPEARSSSAVGIAVGVTVTGAIILIVVLALIYLVFRRRQIRRREKSIVRIENPQYKLPENEERRHTLDRATLSVAPTVKFTANNNAALLSTNNSANSRKRKDAPQPPIYREPSETPGTSKGKDVKRAAPSPPMHMNLELYGKDSPAISTEDLTSAQNTNTTVSPLDETGYSPTEVSHLQPLIDTDRNSSASASKVSSPKKPSRGISNDSTRPLSSSQVSDAVNDYDDDIAGAEDLTSANLRTALLGKKAGSNLSLDSYDKTKNPFFSDS